MFIRIINTYFSDNLKSYIKILVDYYRNEVSNCEYDFDKLESVF